MRIVHLLAPAPVGGIESVVRLLTRGQIDRGHDVTVLATVEAYEHPFVTSLRTEGLPVTPVVVRGREYGRERKAVAATFERVRPQVVHMHGFRPDVLHGGSARAAGAATVTTLHGFTPRNWKVRLYEALQLRAARRASAVVAVSSGVAERLRGAGVAPSRIHLIRNAYAAPETLPSRCEARERLGVPPDTRAVAWLGRLSAEKGPDVALDAFADMADHAAELFFLGDGPGEADIRARAEARGVSDRVHLLGVIPGAGQLLRAFDVLLLSSRTEGTPMVILEAMAAETPIVATAVGGVPDVVSEESAWLVPPENPAAIAAALQSALTNRAEAGARAARAGHVLRDRFGVTAWLDRHDALYASIVR